MMLWGIVLSLTIASGGVVVRADSVSLFNVDPGAPLSAYSAGVTNGVTTYLIGCNASASATSACDFTGPMTLIQGPKTFHAEITKPLSDGVIQSLTVDCPSGTTSSCSVTALNTAHIPTTIALPPASFTAGITALPLVPAASALLYNGVPTPTPSSSVSSSSGNATITSTSSVAKVSGSPTGAYGNATVSSASLAHTTSKAGPSSTVGEAMGSTTPKSAGGRVVASVLGLVVGIVGGLVLL